MGKRLGAIAGALGGLLSLLIGTGVVAAGSDAVVSTGNQVTSGAYRPAHRLAAAVVEPGAACADAPFTHEPMPAAITAGAVDLSGSSQPVAVGRLCIRNDGAEAGQVDLRFASVLEREVGACEPAERETGADASCEDGDDGELSRVLAVRVATPHGLCRTAQGTWDEVVLGVGIAPRLDPGEVCTLDIEVSVAATAGEPARAAAQTDAIQWDLVVSLEERS